MEQRLFAEFENTASQNPNNNFALSLRSLQIALSLINNCSTSHFTSSSLLKTLTLNLQNPDSNPIHQDYKLSLLSALSHHHPSLRHDVFIAVRTFAFSPSTLTSSLFRSLSILFNDAYVTDDVADESLFLSICFRPCKASARHWLLRNVNKFSVRPSVLLTVLLGFTRDPYPLTRKAALDGLVSLCKFVVVEDQSLVQACYFRAVQLLFDAEDSIRCSAVHAVSEWGQLVVACNVENSKSCWSDALFVQLCTMVRDMSMKVRVEAFEALAKVGMVSEDVLLQTLSKKASSGTKGKNYPGQYTAKHFELPASSAAFAFIHGLEDEFYEVRRSACHALHTLTIFSADFASEAVKLLMDMLNDDCIIVRLQALETMHHIAIRGHLKVQEGHLHMFLGTLGDDSTLIRSAARRVLQLMKLDKLAMFKLCFEGLVKILELYPQDEADLFFVVFNIGQNHGKFVVRIIQEASEELEPSFGGRMGFENARTVALLVLAISAPVSIERCICSIPPRIFSYAVTLLGRISCGLVGTVNMNALLAYLSHCSRFTFVSMSEFSEEEGLAFSVLKGDVQCRQINYGLYQCQFEKMLKLTKVGNPILAYQMEMHEEARNYIKIILQKVKDVWPFIRCGCLDVVTRTLRSWKKELMAFTSDSLQSTAELVFTLQYLRVIKLLGRIWVLCMFPMKSHSSGVGDLEILLGKLERSLREMRYRFVGLSKEEDLHILELILVTCTLKMSNVRACCPSATLKKLHYTFSCVERLHESSSSELSSFVAVLQKILCKIGPSIDGPVEDQSEFQNSLESYGMRQFVLSGMIKHVEAELVICNNVENPLHFISGLPVGIPCEIKLYNIACENRLWLRMTLEEKLTQFLFLDLDGASVYDDIRQFTFVAPFYRTPEVSFFSLKVCIAMECSSEPVHLFNNCGGPRCELVYLCREKEVYFSRVIK